MDPITIATGCLAVSKAAMSTGVELHNIITRMKDAPVAMQSLRTQVKVTEQCMRRLHDWLELDPNVLTDDEVHVLQLSLLECKAIMMRIKKDIEKPDKDGKTGFFKRAKHVWNEQDLDKNNERLGAQLNLQQHLISLLSLPMNERAIARQDVSNKSILSTARDNATIYSRQDDEHAANFEDDLANSEAYKSAFASLMNKSRGSTSSRSPLPSEVPQGFKDMSLSTSDTTTPKTRSDRPSRFSLFRPRNKSDHSATVKETPSGNVDETLSSEIRDLSDQLIHAARRGQEDIVCSLIDRGAQINFQDDNKRTALHRVLDAENPFRILRLLLHRKADPNVVDDQGETPLCKAVRLDNKDATRLLVMYSDLERRMSHTLSPLHVAAIGRNISLVKMLLDNGCPVDLRDTTGRTPLQQCVMQGKATAIQTLVDGGANIEINMPFRDYNGYHRAREVIVGTSKDRPLHWAVRSKKVAVVKALLQAGAFADAKSGHRGLYTPLDLALIDHRALQKYQYESRRKPSKGEVSYERVIKEAYFMACGVEPPIGEKDTESALRKVSHIIKCLIDFGADTEGRTID